jgi:hypothetical protein
VLVKETFEIFKQVTMADAKKFMRPEYIKYIEERKEIPDYLMNLDNGQETSVNRLLAAVGISKESRAKGLHYYEEYAKYIFRNYMIKGVIARKDAKNKLHFKKPEWKDLVYIKLPRLPEPAEDLLAPGSREKIFLKHVALLENQLRAFINGVSSQRPFSKGQIFDAMELPFKDDNGLARKYHGFISDRLNTMVKAEILSRTKSNPPEFIRLRPIH